MAFIKVTIALLFFSVAARAQSFSFSDLFGQSKKQLQYYEQQIAAYQAFESELKQGYGVIKNGLSGIAAINTAELNAHTAYYNSLQQPSAVVKNSNQVQDILNWQNGIVLLFSQNFMGLTGDEQNYVAAVKSNLLQECSNDLTEVQNVLTPGKWQMTDDQRLKRIDALHAAMQDKYAFTRDFTSSLKLVAAQRQQELNNAQTLKSIYETN